MVNKDAVRRGYDSLAVAYGNHRSGNPPELEGLDQLAEGRVLDAGCGSGEPVLSRLDDIATPIGLDFSREQLALATRKVPDVPLIQGDLGSLPFADDTFDAVVGFWSIIHIPAAEHQDVIDEFARVLRPGGHLLLNEGIDEWTGTNPDWLDSGVGMEWHLAGADATRQQLRTTGFDIVDTWRATDTLEDDEESDESKDDAAPWIFFEASVAPG